MQRILIFLILTCFVQSGQTASPVVGLNDSQSQILIGQSVSILEDKEGHFTFTDILQKNLQDQFIPNTDEAPNRGYTTSVFWVRMVVRNDSRRPQIWYLEVGYPSLDYVYLYHKSQTGQWVTNRNGDRLPFYSRETVHRNFVFQLDIPHGRADTLYLRIESQGSLSFPLTIMNETAFRDDVHESQLAFGLYYGIFVALMLYNLLIFFSIRDTNYIYYVAYMASYLILQMNFNGLAYEYLWPAFPDWNAIAMPLFIGLVYLFSVGFANRLLITRQLSPRLHRFMQILEFLGVLIIIGAFILPYAVIIRIAAFITLLMAPTIMAAAIIGLIHKYRPARFFFFAWFFFLVGMVLFSLKNFGVVPSNFLTVYSLQIGSALEILLLSLALADRINLLKQELEIKELEKQKLERERFMIARQVTIGILHEIRQPLQVLRGILDVFQLPNSVTPAEKEKLTEKAQQGVDKIKGHLHRLETLEKQYFQHTKAYTHDERMIDLSEQSAVIPPTTDKRTDAGSAGKPSS